MNPLRAVERTATRLYEVVTHPANKGGRAAAVSRAVGWEVRTRLTHRAAAADVVVDGTTRLRVNPGQFSGVWTAYNGLHEWEELQLCLGFLRPGDHFVDVGANVGVFTCLVGTRIPDVQITAIEPFPATLEDLRHNIAANHLELDQPHCDHHEPNEQHTCGHPEPPCKVPRAGTSGTATRPCVRARWSCRGHRGESY